MKNINKLTRLLTSEGLTTTEYVIVKDRSEKFNSDYLRIVRF